MHYKRLVLILSLLCYLPAYASQPYFNYGVLIDEIIGDSRPPMPATKAAIETPEVIVEDYYDTGDHPVIALEPKEEKPKKGYLKSGLDLAAKGLLCAGEYTARYTIGSLATIHFSEASIALFTKATYMTAAYLGAENMVLGYAIYATGMMLAFPVSTALIFYIGFKSPEIVYYSGKTIYKTIELTGNAAFAALKGAKFTVAYVKSWFMDKKQQEQVIELIRLNTPNPQL